MDRTLEVMGLWAYQRESVLWRPNFGLLEHREIKNAREVQKMSRGKGRELGSKRENLASW